RCAAWTRTTPAAPPPAALPARRPGSVLAAPAVDRRAASAPATPASGPPPASPVRPPASCFRKGRARDAAPAAGARGAAGGHAHGAPAGGPWEVSSPPPVERERQPAASPRGPSPA